jgi:hypothetical protein
MSKHCWQSPERPCTENCMAYRTARELSMAGRAPKGASVHAQSNRAEVFTVKQDWATCALFPLSQSDAAVVSIIPGAFHAT